MPAGNYPAGGVRQSHRPRGARQILRVRGDVCHGYRLGQASLRRVPLRQRESDHADGIRRLVSFAEAPGAREASKPVQLTPRADFLKRLPGSHSFELQHLGLAILPSSILLFYGNGSEIPTRNPKLQANSEYQNRTAALASTSRAVTYPPLLRRPTSTLLQVDAVPG